MTPILRSSSAFFFLNSSTSLITGASWSTSCWASAMSASFAWICRCSRNHQIANARTPMTSPAMRAHCARSLPSRTGLILRTAVGRFPSAIRLILIIALVSQLADRQADRDGHHRRDRLEPGRIEVLVAEAHPPEGIHDLDRHFEALPQHLGQVRGKRATAGEHQLVDSALRR